jgi:O-methyltransferase
VDTLAQMLRRWRKTVTDGPEPLPADLRNGDFVAAFEAAAPFTMTSSERMYALYEATRHIGKAAIPGAVVECGVWRGGSSMLAASTLLAAGDVRDLWLYDTFEGMPPPGEADFASQLGQHADELLARDDSLGEGTRAVAGLEEVRANMARVGYPDERVRYVKGKVEETIPAEAPAQIALLRLDTDWYESTRHELEHLYPRLEPGGVLIIDDYGWWEGARKAVDEFFADQPILLNRIDETGRIAVKR